MATATTTETRSPASDPPPPRRLTALAGGLAAVSALALSELAAGLFGSVPSLVEAVGGVFIDNVPSGLKDWAIATFGTNDKAALIVGIVIVVALLGALVGMLAWRRIWIGRLVFLGFGGLGAAAALTTGASTVGAVIGGVVAASGGAAVLAWLLRLIRKDTGAEGVPADLGRRSFMVGAGAVIALAALSVGAGRLLLARAKQMIAGRDEVVLPAPVEMAAPPAETMSFSVPELAPLVTPNADFYVIDTTLSAPRVDLSTWSLRVHGMVDGEFSIDFADLLDMDMVERYVTLSCVSNEVGGHLVGNAKWLGVPLSLILDRAGVQPGADQLVGRSVDGFTVGFPTALAFDGRDALVAVGMNDEPLPFEHGFPARLVVAGLYGYVSATKWLSDLELTTWDAFDAYWVPRGWSKEGPIKTQSRIDTPRHRATVDAAPRAIAGVAWAPNTGIAMVEVQIDEGEWVEAELAEPLDKDTWRQWTLPWTPEPGQHRIAVRATDASGYTQTSDLARPAPDGATGWHTIIVEALSP
ncbi:MAG TPA: molybdopterin-dependent oxidoreductase [Acidimicrobiia bacterium]|nr:molybdopterin-dependent oxidoreductase [Acidimicrobiia bacterium]